jgi:hypothetical protein
MFRSILVLSSLLALPTVAAAQVRVDFDRHQDFSHYRTFDVAIGALVRADGTADEQNTLAEDRLRRAIAGELMARGLESTAVGADLVVRVSGRDTERAEIVSSGFYNNPVYSYRPVRYGYWGRPYFDDVWTRRYLEGSLTIDVTERDTGRLLYRAQVNNEIGNNLDKHITKSVDRAFKKFPVKERGN